MKLRTVLLLLVLLAPQSAIGQEVISGIASVIDGDTIEIHDQRIRLYGIDAPESGQLCKRRGVRYLCGKEAAFALADKIGRHNVTCEERDVDRYERMVAVCMAVGVDLNRWMVSQGQALAYRQYAMDYVSDEEAARAARRGLWAGQFQNPADFRHRRQTGRARQVRAPRPAERHVCICPGDHDRAGRRCGRRSLYFKSDEAKPVCTGRM